jgi:DGQHR domain-containing protein
MKRFTYKAIVPQQSNDHKVFCFCANAKDIFKFSKIDRIGRDQDGHLRGFQRPQISSHINEIKNYLSQSNAILPNSVVIAFTSGVELSESNQTTMDTIVSISVSDEINGLIVDGQQRLSALKDLKDKNFEVFVSGILCSNEDELRKQFILVNNTRPLPKALIYELLPTVDGLPHRLSARSSAASLVERLNFDETSSLHGQIKQHTNPTGFIQDTTMQKVIMNSLNDGALQELAHTDAPDEKQFQLLSNFFQAVQLVLSDSWIGHKPRTSRLVHSAGILAMGYVMEHIFSLEKSTKVESFKPYLEKLIGRCAWTEGSWQFGDNNVRPWNSLQFIPRDYLELSQFLLRTIKY